MARVTKKTNRTPDSGYEFKCQACEDDVLQVPSPELVFALEAKGNGKNMRLVGSEGLQCCVECAEEIKAENERLRKALGLDTSQKRQLRDVEELGLPEDILNATKAKSDASSEKIDKLIDMVSGLTTLVSKLAELEVNRSLQTAKAADVVQVLAPPKPATIPKPKRSILAPPKVKANATSKAKKPTNKAAAKAKPKSRTRR